MALFDFESPACPKCWCSVEAGPRPRGGHLGEGSG